MTHAEKLLERREKLRHQLQSIVSTAKLDGGRGLTSAEREKFHRIEDDFTALDSSIISIERADAIEEQRRREDPVGMRSAFGQPERTRGEHAEDQIRHKAVFGKYLRFGAEALNEQDILFMYSLMPEIPGIQNAQTVTTTGGGYVVPQGFSDELETAMKWYGGILSACSEFTTRDGAPLPWPMINDSNNQGQLISINTQVTETDMVFGSEPFGAYIFSSNLILVPLALAQDSFFDLDTYIAKILGTRLGRVLNQYLTVGTGTSQPTGIQTAVIAAGNTVQGAVGETTAVSYADLVNVTELVDEAYLTLPTTGWMFSQSTRKAIKKLVDSNNRPLWMPGLTSGQGQQVPETLLDWPIFINNSMPAMAANAYPILFGDLSKYMVRRVAGGSTVRRLVERYADYLQIGYLAYTRADGQLLDAGTHPIAAYQNSAT